MKQKVLLMGGTGLCAIGNRAARICCGRDSREGFSSSSACENRNSRQTAADRCAGIGGARSRIQEAMPIELP